MNVLKQQNIPLFFDQFGSEDQKHGPQDFLGENVRLAFDVHSRMDVTAQRSSYTAQDNTSYDTIILRGTNRKLSDWMSLEVDIDAQFDSVDLMMRYAPAERVYPRLYIQSGASNTQLDLPDFTVGLNWSNHHISGKVFDHFSNVPRNQISHLRLALLFPNRPWFALGLSSISQEVRS